jgi:hypothetical protein
LTVARDHSKEGSKLYSESLMAAFEKSTPEEQVAIVHLGERVMHSVAAHNPSARHSNMGEVTQLEVLAAIGQYLNGETA